VALLIHPDGTIEEIKGERTKGDLSVDQIKRLLGGFQVTLEWVPCDPKKSGGYNHFYMDGEAKFKNLPRNDEATRRSTLSFVWDYVSGPALFCKSKNSNGRSY
jgi:hypothetical protein